MSGRSQRSHTRQSTKNARLYCRWATSVRSFPAREVGINENVRLGQQARAATDKEHYACADARSVRTKQLDLLIVEKLRELEAAQKAEHRVTSAQKGFYQVTNGFRHARTAKFRNHLPPRPPARATAFFNTNTSSRSCSSALMEDNVVKRLAEVGRAWTPPPLLAPIPKSWKDWPVPAANSGK